MINIFPNPVKAAIREMAPTSQALSTSQYVAGNSTIPVLRKNKNAKRERSKRKDWIDRGGLGKLAVLLLGLIPFALLFGAPSWFIWLLLSVAILLVIQGLLIGGENSKYSIQILKILGVVVIIGGLFLWWVAKNAD